MDASSLTRNSQGQKQNNEQDIYCSGRTLSELPDHVLSHILSFLQTEEAVRTCILAKRWEYIWTGIPRFSIVQWRGKAANFINFVERAFLLCGSSKDINLVGKVDGISRVEAWMSAAVRCNVQSFALHLDVGDVVEPLSWPLSFVNCRTLSFLCIDIEIMLKLPSPVCLSSLKKLVLIQVGFTDDHSVQQLFSGCPILEWLVLHGCNWENVKVANINFPKLRTLDIREIDWEAYDDPTSSDSCEFVIHANELTLNYLGEFWYDFCILNSSSLEEVSIDTSSYAKSLPGASYRIYKLLSSIAKVPCLKLSGCSTMLLADAPNELLDNMPTFTNLSRLELLDESSDLRCAGLWKILESTSFLKCLVFQQGFFMSSAIAMKLDPVPSCFLNHLDRIYVGGLEDANEVELSAIKILLDNAMVLTKMVIEFGFLEEEDNKKKFCIELLKLHRGSSSCSIHIGGS